MRSGRGRTLSRLIRDLSISFIVLAYLGLFTIPRLGAQQPVLTGWFHVIWSDPRLGQQSRPAEKFLLIGDRGDVTEIQLSDTVAKRVGGMLALNRKYVTVEGQLLGLAPRRLAAATVRITMPPGAAGEAPLRGPQRWVNILCRFADSSTVAPHDMPWFQTLMGVAIPGVDHYWRQQSFDNINIAGTDIFGWFNLPQPRSYYVVNNNLEHGRAVEDCTAVADSSVFFPDYVGINLIFDQDLACCAYGGSWTLNRDGQTRNYRVTWLPPWGYENQGVLGQAMGHGFGLPHSSGPYGAALDSRWDVMSDSWGNCPPHDGTYGCVGVHTISYHKDYLGWIPSSRKYVPTRGSIRTIRLEPLTMPASGSNYLMVQIPIGTSGARFYTFEARFLIGYDQTLPGEAIIIHRVDTTVDRPAQVVDVDGNGDPNDAGAMWTVGETFVDEANGISFSVVSKSSSSFEVTVTTGSPRLSRTAGVTGSSPTATLTVTKSGEGAVTSFPAGINCGATCSAAYPLGTTVLLSAIPSTGWQFTGWSGACSGNKGCRVKLDSDKTVRATFTKKKSQTGQTALQLTNGTAQGIVVYLTLGAVAGSVQDVGAIPFVTNKVNKLQGYFTLPARGSVTYTPPRGMGISGNFAFGTPPLNCPTSQFPHGVNLAEFILNNSYQGSGAQETLDISNVAGVNAIIAFSMTGGGPWNAGSKRPNVTQFANRVLGKNTGLVGVFPCSCDNCTVSTDPPKCPPNPPPPRPEKCQSAPICNVQRSASTAGGSVVITFMGFAR